MKMRKTISALKVRQNLGQVMNEVSLKGDDYVVERAGKPLVAIIPMEKYQRLQNDLDDFYDEVRTFQAGVKDIPEKDIDKALAEATLAAKQAETRRTKSKRNA
jgi:prevent-host-death family protein